MISILFSPKPFVGNDAINQRNALASWRRIADDVELICYGDGEGVAEACAEFGARQVKDVPLSETAAPMFDWIVQHAEREAKYDLQMFINADIFLLPGFFEQLKKIPFRQFLAVSDRLNVRPEFLSGDNLDDAREKLLAESERGLATMNGGSGSDFFIFRRGMWKDLPPVAAGRAGYDNVLMWLCLARNFPLIDVTNAILPLHPNHGYGHVKGGRATTYGGPDVIRNLEYLRGLTIPCLCDATHLLYPSGIVSNRRFHGFPHRWLAWTHVWHEHNYLLRFLARSVHFSITRLGVARPKAWNAQKVLAKMEFA